MCFHIHLFDFFKKKNILGDDDGSTSSMPGLIQRHILDIDDGADGADADKMLVFVDSMDIFIGEPARDDDDDGSTSPMPWYSRKATPPIVIVVEEAPSWN